MLLLSLLPLGELLRRLRRRSESAGLLGLDRRHHLRLLLCHALLLGEKLLLQNQILLLLQDLLTSLLKRLHLLIDAPLSGEATDTGWCDCERFAPCRHGDTSVAGAAPEAALLRDRGGG